MELKKIIKELAKNKTEQDIAIRKTLELSGCNERYGPFKHLQRNALPSPRNSTFEHYSKELDGMFYGTFQKRENGLDLVLTSYGSGPTRLINSAKYSTNQLLTFKEVPILTGFFSAKETEELQEFLKLGCLIHQDIKEPLELFKENFFEIAQGTPTIESNPSRNENLALLASNVRKEGKEYIGELTLRSSEVLGYGNEMITNKKGLSMKTTDAFNLETYNHADLMKKTVMSFDQQKFFKNIAQELSNKIGTPFETNRILNIYNL